MTGSRRGWGFVLGAVVLATVAAGCGGSGSPSTAATVAAGQLAGGEVPTTGSGGAVKSSDTVPLAKQNPVTTLFTAISTFQSCLTGQGVKFIGAPDPSNPNSPANSPAYIKSLTTCAAQSGIVQALKAEQTAQDNLTPTQVKHENQEYLVFRKCMIARGWGIPTPKPNAQGLLFSFGSTGGDASQFTPPPGQSILSSSDLEACAAQAQDGSS